MSESRVPASVYIISFNEERNIERALKSVSRFAEILVVDSGSSDRTVEIARRYTDKVSHQEWLGYSRQKQLALEKCTYPWALNLDADEALTPALEHEIEAMIERDDADGLDIPIVDRFLGAPLRARANRRIRFFRKQKAIYNAVDVHESISVDGRVLQAKAHLLHYSFANLAERTDKLNLYSSLKAGEKARRGKRAGLTKLITIMPLMLFKGFVLRRGFLDGRRGFINAMMTSYYAFLKEAKLYEEELSRRANQARAPGD
ncbi:MAG: glycosyltransferase family 2 protein [Gammaproteobacteria bacterium]|nr:glycosyltransferase family 2 protein [Gammaproteobacteria bacterium]